MEGGDQATDWDSDETVIEGSVTESDPEDEELPWRRLLFDQDTSLRSVYKFHPGISTTWKGTTSPEIQLAFKLREDPQKQLSANKLPLHNEDKILQKPQDEMEQNQVLLQTRQNCSRLTESYSQAELLLSHQSMKGFSLFISNSLQHEVMVLGKYDFSELSEDRDSAEISLLSGTFLTVSDTALVKDKLLIEPEKMLIGSHIFSEPGMEVTLEMTSEEKSEENSLETFVSALEITEEDRLLEIMSDFEPTELINPLSKSANSISIPLTCHRDLLEHTNDNALPTELLSSSLNPKSESQVDPICHRVEEGNSVSAESKRLGIERTLSQTNEDSTHIAEESFDTCEDQNPFELQTLVHQNVTFCDPLNNEGNSNPLDVNSDQDTPIVLRRSSRLKIGRQEQHRDERCTMSEKILPEMVDREDQTSRDSSNENSRMQNPALVIEAKGKNAHSSRLKSREQIRKSKKLAKKYEKMQLDNIPLSAINRRNVFGENLLYKAALHDDTNLVLHYLKQGGNVNQQSYAGWTALHEACVGGFYQTASELIKGGADVNIKGMYQITPLHDAVVNGHYKVAELLLLNGADPLLRSDSGKCALDEAKDSRVKRLLERYVSKHQKPLRSAQKNSVDLVDVEDTHQHKKPKYSSRKCTGFTFEENSNRKKPEHINLGRESKEYLRINKEDVYEHHQKRSANIRLGKSKHKELILNQTKSRGLRKDNLPYVKDSSSDISKDKGIRNTRHKRTRMDDTIQAVSPRKTAAVSSSGRIKRLVIDQQHSPQTLDDFPEESCKPDSSTVSSMKNALGNNIEIFSVSKEKYTQDLDPSTSQEIKILELKSVEQAETISFSGISSHKKIESSFVITEELSHTHKEKQQISSCKSYENSNLGQKDESINKWEKSFLFFIEKKRNDEIDHCASEETVTSKMVMSSIDHKTHCDYKENMTYRDEMDLQPHLLSEDHFSQENEFKADVLTILPQQEAVHFSDSDNTVVSGQHVDQHIYGTSLDHSQNNFEHTSLAHMRTLSTHEISELTSQVEVFEKRQDCNLMMPTPLTNQTDTHNVEKVDQQEEIKRNYTNKSPDPGSSNRPLSTGQVIGTMEVEQRREDLPDTEVICNINFHSTDNISDDSTSISQFIHRETRKASHKPDEELTNTIEDEITSSTSRNCEMEEIRDSEIHVPTCVQEHKKIKNFSLNQNLLKDTCRQEMKTAGVSKRNVTGESQLHSAARRGNVSLVKSLIESEADVNLKDNADWTPFHEAASEGAKDVIGELLIAGADVNCENIDGILPLHDAVANNHLKTAEILQHHGANPNQKDKKQNATLDKTGNVTMLKSYGTTETDNRDENNTIDTVQIPFAQSKRCKQRIYDDHKTIDPPCLTRQRRTRQIHPVHQKISAILQDIEEKQENLLEFEIKTPEDAEDYIEKMSEIKEVMDSVLSKQKAERDDLAKKYRVSIESFKHGVLREQLANLATRQKKLLVVAQKQKEISLKIQNYKNVKSLSSGLTLKKQPSSSEASGYKDSQEFPSLGQSVQCQPRALSPDSLVCGSMEEDTQLSQEMGNHSQPTNPYPDAETMRRGEISGKELNSKLNIDKHTLDGSFQRRQPDGNELLSQPLSFITQAEHSPNSSGPRETIAKGSAPNSPSKVSGTLSISETTLNISETQDKAYPLSVVCDQTLFSGDPKIKNRKTISQQLPQGASESPKIKTFSVSGEEAGHQMKPYLQKSASAAPRTNDSQACHSSASSPPRTIRKPSNHSTAPRKKHMQIKDLILLGRISPGKNILEFKTQETTHKASVLLSGKIKVETGQIYQNPVTWLKDLLGGNRRVTWNYAWNKVTYLGKELLKYVSEEVPTPPEASSAAQQHQLCLPGVSRESMQSIPHYLQINEILLINDQEFLPHHIMDEHWKFYTECDELAF
ncbi:ankyrin repeat domain-containing protein 31 [Sorex araneus]|uniref:ankyrin repeat domain-containing protein 31 n=1 Tax=Sorex araneus TaxID=42254 RepID=UPI002433E07C|nr:ankyrin repeat domain-containing protein 31 [Sorex araneus]